MHRIVASITTLDQHLEAVGATPEIYRPDACPHCRLSGLWRHGCYHRKADRSDRGRGPLKRVKKVALAADGSALPARDPGP